MPARLLRYGWIAAICLATFFLYFFHLDALGLFGPDEPRYASIAREMARSGDWITPRLWGAPWFEKPALLYWLAALGFEAGLPGESAPRLPVAALSVVFLAFYFWIVRREFGLTVAACSSAMLGTSAFWLAYSQACVTDIPLSATFCAAMLLVMSWLRQVTAETALGSRVERTAAGRGLTAAAALLGLAVLAKGLVPLVLALPAFWFGRRQWREFFRPAPLGAFAATALPWYLLCTFRNGTPFLRVFFWQHHVERFASTSLQHVQPPWFFLPLLLGALFPWTPLLVLLFRRRLYADVRLRFALAWFAFGFLFFSASRNKLPGYILPLLPSVTLLIGVAWSRAHKARWWVLACGLLLALFAPLELILPNAVERGAGSIVSTAELPAWHGIAALVPAVLVLFFLIRSQPQRAFATICLGVTLAIAHLKATVVVELDDRASARPLWRQAAPLRGSICTGKLSRNWQYGLNYYAGVPLPECSAAPSAYVVEETDGRPEIRKR